MYGQPKNILSFQLQTIRRLNNAVMHILFSNLPIVNTLQDFICLNIAMEISIACVLHF